ncbi:MAG TPA: ATP-dependent DNA ligase [Bryobacteraceae bacterium]|jgi:DNA ligase-1|nr:ATP-dependent DNA ligase [Bryobacteraceae bacterium]
MLLARIVETSRAMTATSKRLAKIDLLSALLGQLDPEEVEVVVAWLSGTTRQGRIGVGYAIIREAVTVPATESSLEILPVDHTFSDIASVRGAGAAQQRHQLLRGLFERATEPEQQFLIGVIGGELRQGALEGIMIESLAKASRIGVDRIRRAAMMAGSIVSIARPVLERGEAALSAFDVRLFRPVQPMLAQSAEDVSEALEELGDAALEYKFDGARVQAHKSGEDVSIYSRAMNDVSPAIPEVVQVVRALPAHDLILDGEVLSLDAQGRPQPFQVSMRRFGRKVNVHQLVSELPMTPFWFDVLYLNGKPVLDHAQSERFEELRRLTPENHLVPNLRTSRPEQAEQFVRSALERGHEGIMAKAPNAPYAAGARGQSWLKVKQARTLDLVILAAEWGSGRRKGFLSNLHLGARDTEKGGFAMLGKTFKGLTDALLTWQTQEFLKIEIARDAYTVYLEPRIVAEVAFNEIQVSPRYPSGLALRFARVKRYRADKSAEEADTFQMVQRMASAT